MYKQMKFFFFYLTISITNVLVCALKCDEKYEKEGVLFGIKDFKKFNAFTVQLVKNIDNAPNSKPIHRHHVNVQYDEKNKIKDLYTANFEKSYHFQKISTINYKSKRRYKFTEESGTKKCNLEYINYNDLTIFNHNFSETNLDSTKGFFLNKRYRAIKSIKNIPYTYNRQRARYKSCFLFDEGRTKYETDLSFKIPSKYDKSPNFFFYLKLNVSFESGYNKVLSFSNFIDVLIGQDEPILDIQLEEPYKIVCKGRKGYDQPNITLLHQKDLRSKKLHLLSTEVFDYKDVLKPSITADIYFDFSRLLFRINIDHSTDYVIDSFHEKAYKSLNNRCEVFKNTNQFPFEEMFSKDSFFSTDGMKGIYNFNLYKYANFHKIHPNSSIVEHYYIHEYINKKNNTVLNTLTIKQDLDTLEYIPTQIEHKYYSDNKNFQTTEVKIEVLDSNVKRKDFDVSYCYENRPLEIYKIKFENISKEYLKEISTKFDLFRDDLISEITIKIYVSQLRISNDVKHYVKNNSLYVTFSIYPLLKTIPKISTSKKPVKSLFLSENEIKNEIDNLINSGNLTVYFKLNDKKTILLKAYEEKSSTSNNCYEEIQSNLEKFKEETTTKFFKKLEKVSTGLTVETRRKKLKKPIVEKQNEIPARPAVERKNDIFTTLNEKTLNKMTPIKNSESSSKVTTTNTLNTQTLDKQNKTDCKDLHSTNFVVLVVSLVFIAVIVLNIVVLKYWKNFYGCKKTISDLVLLC